MESGRPAFIEAPLVIAVAAAGLLVTSVSAVNARRPIHTESVVLSIDPQGPSGRSVVLQFVDATGQAHQITRRYAPRRGVSLPAATPGTRVPVAYHPDEPQRAVIAAFQKHDNFGRLVIGGFCGALVLFGVWRRRFRRSF